MIYHQAKDPDSYQTIFYKQIGLKRRSAALPEKMIGQTIRLALSIPMVAWTPFSLESVITPSQRIFLLNFNIIPNIFMLVLFTRASPILSLKIVWNSLLFHRHFLRLNRQAVVSTVGKKGQHFKGVEISIETNYLKHKILPYLGASEDSLDFLIKNVRHIHLPKELTDLILQVQSLLESRSMTPALLLALSTSFTALLIRQANRQFFFSGADLMSERIFVGNRPIRIRPDEYKKIIAAHDLLRDHSDSFVTIYALSQTLGIGEQKLKAGFQELYQQTIWDYSNQIRMTKAASLLKNTDKTVDEIARLTGYQSPAAFRTMFKKWSQTTPRKFRSYFSGTD